MSEVVKQFRVRLVNSKCKRLRTSRRFKVACKKLERLRLDADKRRS